MQIAACVLSIASRANAKSLHALWSIRAPTSRLRQSERHVPAAPIRTLEVSSRLSGQRRVLTLIGASRLQAHASRNIALKAVPFPIQVSVPITSVWPACLSLYGFDNEPLKAHHQMNWVFVTVTTTTFLKGRVQGYHILQRRRSRHTSTPPPTLLSAAYSGAESSDCRDGR